MKKNIKTSSYILALISVITLITTSCKKDVMEDLTTKSIENGNSTEYKPNSDNLIVLGKKIDNPYSVKNMELAYQDLLRSGRLENSESPVKTTHLYVRFLPNSWAQYDTLVADTSLELYNIPLDYEIAVCGNQYHDPSIAADLPTWQYTSVPVNYKFNSAIKYELLSELYIPELDASLNNSTQRTAINGKSFKDVLLDKAFVLTKNYSDTLKTTNARTNWNPNGTVRVSDTRLGKDIPLEGVKIRCRRWVFVKVREAITDANGWYQTGSFERPVNYSLIFETNNFDIRTGTFGQASVDGPKSSGAWNITFSVDDVNRFYAHVFRGAYRYHYKEIGGLKRPYFNFKLKYAAYDKAGEAQGVNIGNWSIFAINPNIFIYRLGSQGQYESDEIFSTTIHETCHSTHVQVMNAGYIQYSQVDETIAESWPVAVEWYITSMEYRERGIVDYGKENYVNLSNRGSYASYPLHRGYQYWPMNSNRKYSSVFIDLVDNFNQKGTVFSGFGISTIDDQITGYNIASIESGFLKHVYGLSSLREQCKKNKPIGVNDTQLDILLNNF